MTPLKMAKIQVCTPCEHRKVESGWPWARCMHRNRAVELSDLFFEGEASECDAGKFDGLDPESMLEPELLAQIAEAQKRAALVAEYDAALPADRPPVASMAPDWRIEGLEYRKEKCDDCDGVASGKPCTVKQCKSCRKTAVMANAAMACPDNPPHWRPMQKNIKAVWIISAWNEPLVGATVAELRASSVDPYIDFDVIVVDDGSTDGSCANLDCKVIRNEEPKGIGYNLNVGTLEALKDGADVVGVSDAHMTYPKGVVDALSRRAMEERCILCSASFGWEVESKMRQWGAYFVRMRQNCIAARWVGGKWPLLPGEKFHHPAERWAEVQIPLGACYAYSRDTIEAMMKPTGRLWETVVGRWGFLLEPFSAKAWLLGIPVRVARDHYARHMYRGKNPCPQAHVHKVRNTAFGTASVFHPATWAKHFEPWCKTRGGVDRPEIDALAEQAREGVVRTWTVAEEEALIASMPDLIEEVGPDKRGTEKTITLEKILLRSRYDKMVRAEKARRKEERDA